MDDTGLRRNDIEIVESFLAPFEKLVALPVALELDLHVHVQRIGTVREVDLDGVVDDEIDRNERLDDLRLFAGVRSRRAHRSEVDEQRHAREVLQENAGDHERDLFLPLSGAAPVREHLHVVLSDLLPIHVAEHGLEDDADRDGQLRHRSDSRLLELRERVELAPLAVAEIEGVEGIERILRH